MPAYSSMGFKKKGRSTFPVSYQRKIRGFIINMRAGAGVGVVFWHYQHTSVLMTKQIDEREIKSTESMYCVVEKYDFE
jgi:hypothetical protein